MALKASPFRRAEDPTKVYLDVNVGQGAQPQKTFELSQEALQGLGYTPQEVETRYNQPIYGESGQLTSTEQLRSLFSGQRVGTKGEKGLENIFDIGATGATAYQAPQPGYVPGGALDVDPRLFSILTGETKQFGTTPISGLAPVEQPTAYQQAFQQGKQDGMTPEQISQQYAQQQQALPGGLAGTTPPTQSTQPTAQPMQPTQPQAQSGEELSKSGQYYKVGNDVFDQSGRKLELPEFKQLGLNFALLPEKGQAGQVGQQDGQETGQPGQDGQEYFKKLAPGGGYYDIFDQSGRKITQEEFQSKGLNAEHIPEITSGTATDTTKSDTDVMNIFNGITDKDLFGNNKSITDVVKEISTAFGLTDINAEIQKVDDQFAEDAKDINMNPWISEGMRSKQLTALQSKYENKKNALVDRLKLQSDVVGKAIDYWQKEREYKKDLLFKQLDMASKTLDEKKAPTTLETSQGIMQWNPKTGTWESTGFIKPISASERALTEGGLTPKQTSIAIQLANSLKAHPAYTDMQDIHTGMTGVQVGLSQKNGFGDITAINAFQRMVDPGATVREGDVSLLQSGSAFIDKILSDYPIEKLQKGAKLPEETRNAMLKTAQDLYERRAGNYNETIGNQYRSLAAGSAIPFEYIGQDFPSKSSIPSAPQAPTYKQVEGVPDEPASIIQHNLDTGATLEEIRQGLSSLYGRDLGYQYLDKYIGQ